MMSHNFPNGVVKTSTAKDIIQPPPAVGYLGGMPFVEAVDGNALPDMGGYTRVSFSRYGYSALPKGSVVDVDTKAYRSHCSSLGMQPAGHVSFISAYIDEFTAYPSTGDIKIKVPHDATPGDGDSKVSALLLEGTMRMAEIRTSADLRSVPLDQLEQHPLKRRHRDWLPIGMLSTSAVVSSYAVGSLYGLYGLAGAVIAGMFAESAVRKIPKDRIWPPEIRARRARELASSSAAMITLTPAEGFKV